MKRPLSWCRLLAVVGVASLMLIAPTTVVAVSSTSSAEPQPTNVQQVHRVAFKLVKAINNEHQGVARRYATRRVVRKLTAGQALFLDRCYKTPANPPDDVTYDGPSKYGCTIYDIGSYSYGVGFVRIEGIWQAVDVIDMAH